MRLSPMSNEPVLGLQTAVPARLVLLPAVAVAVAWVAHGISHRAMRQAANTTHEPMMAMSMSMPPPFAVPPLGLGPRTHGLKDRCSTS